MFHEIYLIESHFRLCIVSLIDVKPSRITTAIFVSQNNEMAAQGRIKGGGHFGQVPGAPRFRGAPQILWASRLFMAPCFSGPHRTVLGGHIIYVSGRWGPKF